MTYRILYIDDEPDLREIAAMALELDPELEVRTCSSGAEALEIVPQWRPALILLDLMMPEMDGAATFRRLRQLHGEEFPVAFITARAGEADVSRLMALGAIGVIAKPFDPLKLADDAQRLLAR